MTTTETRSISSTALLIAEALLARFDIHMSHKSLSVALNDHLSIYSRLLRAQLANISNGIIYQQAYDRQLFLQKLFIDYRLSPEFAKDKESPGAATRGVLKDYYDETSVLVKNLGEQQFKHYQLISESQASSIKATKGLKNPTNDLTRLLDDAEFIAQIDAFVVRAEELAKVFTEYSQRFYELSLKTLTSLEVLPDYRLDPLEIEAAREDIFFDPFPLEKEESTTVQVS